MRVLTVNPGSSSLKLTVLGDGDEVLLGEQVDVGDGGLRADLLRRALAGGPPVEAAGVRVVHGGPEFRAAAIADASMVARLDRLADLAPLHNPASTAALRILLDLLAGPVVACFDTAFHATLPDAAAVYAIPWEWTQRWGLRRFGFHGLSHAYAARRAASLLGVAAGDLRMVTCHLGAGASLAAVDRGRCVDTTMGFTPMDGLVMATRSGSVDPGLLLWVQRHAGMSAQDLERALDRESGLAGLSGVSGDMREVVASADHGETRAQMALDVYLHRLRAAIAAMATALGGLDALVFTGGVGENSSLVRERCCAGLGFLGLPETLSGNRGDEVISAPGDAVAVVVVHAREDVEIAREVRRLTAG